MVTFWVNPLPTPLKKIQLKKLRLSLMNVVVLTFFNYLVMTNHKKKLYVTAIMLTFFEASLMKIHKKHTIKLQAK